jgi:aspartate ammonia-lyase
MRIEHDLIGEKEISDDAYYGIHTIRSFENFPILSQPLHPELINSLAIVKAASAMANKRTGKLPVEIADAIISSAIEIYDGLWHDHFITDAMQGGAGTSANMNANEVIANIALEKCGHLKGEYQYIDPFHDVNCQQSTNDVFPTALRIASLKILLKVIDDFANLQDALQKKESEFASIVALGRTEMQDAVPITIGQRFSAWAQAIQRDWWRLHVVEEKLRQVNLGGTAVGTGLNAEQKYIFIAVEHLRELTGLNIARAENMIDITQNADVFVEVSGVLKTAAVNLIKISSDLRILSSGPHGGINEFILSDLQAGSSIMPGKVNPVMTEAVTQAAFQIIANDTAITMAAQAGQLELNAFLPLIAHNLLQSLTILHNIIPQFINKCIKTITLNEKQIFENLNNSFALATAISPYIGYELASELTKIAIKEDRPLQEIIVEMNIFSCKELEKIMSLYELTTPGIAGEKWFKDKLYKK